MSEKKETEKKNCLTGSNALDLFLYYTSAYKLTFYDIAIISNK
jgi:hypothetical protein